MPNLRELQQQFYNCLVDQSSPEAVADMANYLQLHGELSNESRIKIYQQNSLNALRGVLQSIFPTVFAIVGDTLFMRWGREYGLQANTSVHDLNYYGEYFPEFIERQCTEQEQLKDYFYLGDLARLEYHYHAAYYAENDAVFNFSEFESFAQQPEQLYFTCSQAVYLLETDFPVYNIWKAHKDQQQCEAVAALNRSEILCVYREDDRPKVEKIDRDIYELLSCCETCSLAELVEQEDTQAGLSQINHLIEKQWITGVKQGD